MFSFKGRTKRLHYFFWEFGCGGALLIAAFAYVMVCAANHLPQAEMNRGLAPLFLVVGLPLTWLRMAAASRRAYDAAINRWFVRAYATLSFGSIVLQAGQAWYGLAGSGMLGLALLGMWAYFQTASSKDRVSDLDVETFGAAPVASTVAPGVDPVRGLAPLRSDDALVQRAAELRAVEPSHPIASTSGRPRAGAAPGGFGRRTQPAFGKR